MKKDVIHSTDYRLSFGKQPLIGFQMLFVAFGALVLVPLLTGLDPSVALFTAGLGTLFFQYITKGKVPIFLASSFAFIAPIIYGVQTWGIPGTMCGLLFAGIFYMVLSVLIRVYGSAFLHKLLPPVVTGPVIMVIGLILAPVGVNMALGKSGDGGLVLVDPFIAKIVFAVTLLTVVIFSLKAKGIFRLIPILVGVIVGYIFSLALGIVDFQGVVNAPWLAIPSFTLPEWNLAAIFFIVPVAIAPAIEHFGDVMAIGGVTGKDYVKKDPGIHRTMFGDGLATSIAAVLGGPPNTTYSEVTGAVTITKAFNPAVMTWAAIFAIALSFVGKLGALLQSVPVPVMGGIMMLLFGAITVVGIGILIKNQVDHTNNRNLIIIALILVTGIGGMIFSWGNFSISGIGLAGIVGVILNRVLPEDEKVEE
jgi:uracil permease